MVIMANVVANLMSDATALRMGKLGTSARVLIISKLFVVQGYSQDGTEPSPKQEVTAAQT